MENNPGPAVFNKTNQTTTVSAGQNSRNRPKHTLPGKRWQALYNVLQLCLYLHLYMFIYTPIYCCVGFPTQSRRQRYFFISLFIYLSTDRSARHVVSSLGVLT